MNGVTRMSRKMDCRKRPRPRTAGRFIVVREELTLLTHFRESSDGDKAHLQRIAAAFAHTRRK
ncbi:MULTISPECIES: hypothetical protein [unclassified Pseudomonas]|uniref:hypothetical protein n=1 Tax=unclassified Pseudomonas TaxID=196821 RepID=UPI00177EAC8A|nr:MULTISPECIES: hypothetical protein [unclassified Pseudomonas]MBD8594767.1 hypothetical protein [Pseudomonas sp. CFBP 8758]MBD8682833.1 hypothetical protein [Pseudomonas sp. CFBP 13719]